MSKTIEIMDTTLRDGEQTSGVSFSVSEKLTLAKLLLKELNIDRIEIASARVSDGEFNAVKEITSWGVANNCIDRIEVLTFVDNGTSIKWMKDAGAQVQNLLTKGSLNHLKFQIKSSFQFVKTSFYLFGWVIKAIVYCSSSIVSSVSSIFLEKFFTRPTQRIYTTVYIDLQSLREL